MLQNNKRTLIKAHKTLWDPWIAPTHCIPKRIVPVFIFECVMCKGGRTSSSVPAFWNRTGKQRGRRRQGRDWHSIRKLITNMGSCFSHVLENLCTSEIRQAENECKTGQHCRQGHFTMIALFFNSLQGTNDFFIPLGKFCNMQGNHQERHTQNPWENREKVGLENILGLASFAATKPRRSIQLLCESKKNG